MKNFLIIIFLSIVSVAFSQKGESDMFIQDDEFSDRPEVSKPDPEQKKVFTNIAMGSSIMSSGGDAYSFNTYVNPTVGYRLSPKLSVSVGVMAVQTNLNNYKIYNYQENQVENMNYSGLNTYFTASASYQLNEKINVYGGVMVGGQTMDFAGVQLDNHNNSTPTAYRLGVEYKIGRNAYLQFEVQYHDLTPMQQMQTQSGSGMGMSRSSSMFGPGMR